MVMSQPKEGIRKQEGPKIGSIEIPKKIYDENSVIAYESESEIRKGEYLNTQFGTSQQFEQLIQDQFKNKIVTQPQENQILTDKNQNQIKTENQKQNQINIENQQQNQINIKNQQQNQNQNVTQDELYDQIVRFIFECDVNQVKDSLEIMNKMEYYDLINKQDELGNTLLMLACKLQSIDIRYHDIIALLLKYDANPKQMDKNKWSCMEECLFQKNIGTSLKILNSLIVQKFHSIQNTKRQIDMILGQLPDFYVEIQFNFTSNVIPFVQKFAPQETFKITKYGRQIKCETNFGGFKKYKLKKEKQIIYYHTSSEVVKDISNFLVIANLDKKKYYYPLQKLDGEEKVLIVQDLIKNENLQGNLQIMDVQTKKSKSLFGNNISESVQGYQTQKFDLNLKYKYSLSKNRQDEFFDQQSEQDYILEDKTGTNSRSNSPRKVIFQNSVIYQNEKKFNPQIQRIIQKGGTCVLPQNNFSGIQSLNLQNSFQLFNQDPQRRKSKLASIAIDGQNSNSILLLEESQPSFQPIQQINSVLNPQSNRKLSNQQSTLLVKPKKKKQQEKAKKSKVNLWVSKEYPLRFIDILPIIKILGLGNELLVNLTDMLEQDTVNQILMNEGIKMDQEENSDFSESNPQEVQGKLNFACGVKNCDSKFKGNKKVEAQQDFLLHFNERHQDIIVDQGLSNEKQIIKTYLKKHQKLNYYCKICKKNGEDQRFSQVNNVKDRSGLEPHVKHKHPELFTSKEQKDLQKNDQNAWREQWCGYSGPQRTTVGRPNNNYIPSKYGSGQQDAESDNEINEEEEKFYLSLGINVRKNRQIELSEFKKYLDIIEILFSQKEIIEQKQKEIYPNYVTNDQRPNAQFIEKIGSEYLHPYLDEQCQNKFSNLCYLVYNQRNPEVKKVENSQQYPEGCKDYLGFIIIACVKKICQLKNNINIQLSMQEEEAINLFQSVFENFNQFFQEIQTSNIPNI
ncbi:Ankyrin repeat-containing domain [Pseudocohnilembus persalinus]|uniref:Ankyrin repeat-containing domain n=1 Tax=Pseudocohnilembus persalinus TaxID=266149 RepID=A0A0V0R1A2_PSEPJ|nr:Ankyrin repeat-containing domain [Pseudocohnilembus persalinus]|eukprot:KRX08310.1 Ankyrin repeat-containing domain [Pseudocohnilembus persalinus]